MQAGNFSGWTFHPPSILPAPFDTVWCRFPYVEAPQVPGKGRPGLIRQAFLDQDGNPWVRVIYGTSVDPYRRGHENFAVVELVEMNMCGLKCATRFCLNREAELPYACEFFEALSGQPTPIIGHLAHYKQKILQIQASYMQAGMS